MTVKSAAFFTGIGAAAGAVAILMMPRSNPTRKLADGAAREMEQAAQKVTNAMTD